jgi:hypothetical protein
MAERKRKPENTMTQIIAIRQELDNATQEKMRLSEICYSNIKLIALNAASARFYGKIVITIYGANNTRIIVGMPHP